MLSNWEKRVCMSFRFNDIADFSKWRIIREIDEGWSSDRKYYIETKEGEKLLLRVADASLKKQKKLEFERISALSSTRFPMSRPIAFGNCNQGRSVYMLLTWVDGVPLRSRLPKMSVAEQYETGLQAGKMLKEIHSIPVTDKHIVSPEARRVHKLNKIKNYETSYVRVDGDEDAIRYVRDHIDEIYTTPSAYKHGDFHAGNLIYTPDGSLGLIDFNRIDCGDRYEDFNKTSIMDAALSIPFATGIIDGYWGDEPPKEFWQVMSIYVAQSSMTSINWAEKFGLEEIQTYQDLCRQALKDYDHYRKNIPAWYEKP